MAKLDEFMVETKEEALRALKAASVLLRAVENSRWRRMVALNAVEDIDDAVRALEESE